MKVLTAFYGLVWARECRVTIWHGDTRVWPSISLRCRSEERFLKHERIIIEFCKRGTQNCMRMGGNISSKNQWKISRQVTKLLPRKSTSYLSGKLFRTSILFQESELCFQRFQEFRPRNLSSSVLTFFRCFSSSSGVFFFNFRCVHRAGYAPQMTIHGKVREAQEYLQISME